MSASIVSATDGARFVRASRAAAGVAGRGAGARPSLGNPPVLVMREVRKSFEAGVCGCSAVVRVLAGVSLVVGRGEIVGIAGDAGAGKSTLLHCAAGMVRPECGSVEWLEGDARGARGAEPPGVYIDAGRAPRGRELRGLVERGSALLIVDHATPVLLEELRATLAGCPRGLCGAVLVASRSGADLARVAVRVLVLRDGRLRSLRAGAAPFAAPALPQRKRLAARASSEFPASFARARMRST